MIRRLSFGFVVVLVTAFIVVACGRQVTPNPPGLGPGGAPPGYIAIHYDVYSPFNFSNYQYMIVFNTSGTGVTPSTDTVQTNWAAIRSPWLHWALPEPRMRRPYSSFEIKILTFLRRG